LCRFVHWGTLGPHAIFCPDETNYVFRINESTYNNA
jgi:hypothetical protein